MPQSHTQVFLAHKPANHLPSFVTGLDLQGNTYWEFRDVRGDDRAGKWRRIVQYPRNTHYGEVKVPPQWHQWLRHIRESPPSLQEQHLEVRRQAQMKYLAAEADARWEAKPRLTDAPAAAGTAGQPVAALEERSAGREAEDDEGGEGREKGRDAIATGKEQEKAAQGNRRDMEKPDPGKQKRRAGPSEDWQPQAWTPPASKR